LHMLHQLNGLAAYIQAEDLRKKGLRLEACLQALQDLTTESILREVAPFASSWKAAYITCVTQHLTPYEESLQASSTLNDT
jgi:hypothetical protein